MIDESNDTHFRLSKFTVLIAILGIGALVAGYVVGYVKGINDLYTFNTLPSNWIELDSKHGIALMNGTEVAFVWRENNETMTLRLKSDISLGTKQEQGTLYLLADPIALPKQIADLLHLQPQQHYVFQNQQNINYRLSPA